MEGTPVGFDVFEFAPALFERVWGGSQLAARFPGEPHADAPLGEAWLISDHPQHNSRVVTGPHAGKSLHELLCLDERALLGRWPGLSRGGRFPLMLKLLDCTDVLSVQIHPDDALSAALCEEDGGKTEMWYFVEATPGAEIICGLRDAPDAATLKAAAQDGTIGALLRRWPVSGGDAALVKAGTVHALGKGLLAAEIQQTSDVTYRLFDWNRVGIDGKPRELHIDKAMQCVALHTPFDGLAVPLPLDAREAQRELLGACPFFAAERLSLDNGAETRETRGESFHILLGLEGELTISAGEGNATLRSGRAILVAGAQQRFHVKGDGMLLDYYVPGPEILALTARV